MTIIEHPIIFIVMRSHMNYFLEDSTIEDGLPLTIRRLGSDGSHNTANDRAVSNDNQYQAYYDFYLNYYSKKGQSTKVEQPIETQNNKHVNAISSLVSYSVSDEDD
jgi:hypothetical protein